MVQIAQIKPNVKVKVYQNVKITTTYCSSFFTRICFKTFIEYFICSEQ